MGAFDLGWQTAATKRLQDQQIAEQQRVENQNTVGARLLDSINSAAAIKPPTDPQTIQDETGKTVPNPVYQSKKDAYDQAQAQKADLFQKYVALNSPEQHASFGDRIHALIFGNPTEHAQQPATSPNSAPVKPMADPNAPAPVAPLPDPNASGGGVAHPLAPASPDHPLHTITKGIKTLESHLASFAHPTLPDKTSATAASLAASYQDPAQLQFERNKVLYGIKGENALDLQTAKGTTAVDVAKIRAHYQMLNTPEKMRIDAGAKDLGYDDFYSAPPPVMDSLLKQYAADKRAPIKNIVMDPSSPTGYSAAEWDSATGKPISYFQGVLPPRGFVPTHRATTDAFGNTTISDTTPGISAAGAPSLPAANPITSGMPTPPVSSAAPAFPSTPANPVLQRPPNLAAPTAPVPQSANPGARLPGTKPAGAAVKARPISANAPSAPTSQPAALDADGHIPDGVGNNLVRQYANNLLDGQDSKDIPNPGARAAAEAMASQYGWNRGAFTPREKVQFQTATTFLHQLKGEDADGNPLPGGSPLGVLDSFVSREKIARAMKDPKSMGLVDRIAAYNLNPQEAEFLRLYNAALGTVQGLSSITRSGRATESSVNRLKTELPNVLQSPSSTDAKARIDQLLKEANVALHTNPMNVGKKGPVSTKAPSAPGTPKVGDVKVFPNGKKGVWDGQGYVAQ